MYINITDTSMANNKGRSGGLVNYLEKENRLENKNEPEYWFNHSANNIESYEVRHAIDNNIARLCKTDAKFFLVNISPSQKELKYLIEEFGQSGVKEKMRIYAEHVMDEYAKNFKREGINSAKDLIWFGKIENHRYYCYSDKEVLNGERKRGERKEGNQMHAQIIVSRKDASNRIKLSPLNNSKGKNEAHSKKLGQFNRVAFKNSGESVFDGLFGFDRKLKETFAHANIKKNGDIVQKEQLSILEMKAGNDSHSAGAVIGLARGVSDGIYPSAGDMLTNVGKTVSGFLELILEPVYVPGAWAVGNDGPNGEKKKKRKGQHKGIQR